MNRNRLKPAPAKSQEGWVCGFKGIFYPNNSMSLHPIPGNFDGVNFIRACLKNFIGLE